MSKQPVIYLWDVETGYMSGYFHSLWVDNLPYVAVETQKYIICAVFKNLLTGEMHKVSLLDDPKRFARDPHDDRYVVKQIHKILSKADAVIAHNGDKFDTKVFNTQNVLHGLPPLPNLIQIDTLKMARNKFKFPSNRLDALGDFLGVGRKIPTNYKLWLDCFQGKKKAVKDMLKYNVQDVLLLEDVYNKLAPYLPAKLNRQLFDAQAGSCPSCGSRHVHARGYSYTRTRRAQRYQCQSCGHWFQDTTSSNKVKATQK